PVGANCQVAIPDAHFNVTATDTCTPAESLIITQSPAVDSFVGPGVHPITVTATDAAGNSSSCTINFTVVDTKRPTVSCPPGTTASASANYQAPVRNVLGRVTAYYDCTPA